MHRTTLLWGGWKKSRYHKEPYAQEMKKRLLLRTGASEQPTDGVGGKKYKDAVENVARAFRRVPLQRTRSPRRLDGR